MVRRSQRTPHGANGALVEKRDALSDHEDAFLSGDVGVDVGAYGLHLGLCLVYGMCYVSSALSENLALAVGGIVV